MSFLTNRVRISSHDCAALAMDTVREILHNERRSKPREVVAALKSTRKASTVCSHRAGRHQVPLITVCMGA